MRRIIIIGTTGSGKTWLGQQLGQNLGLPVYDLDDFYWQPDWKLSQPDVFQAQTAAAIAGNAWIVTGNYHLVRDRVWARGDTLIWLDYSLPRTIWQLLGRTRRNLTQCETLCNGNVETWRRVCSRRSIFIWLLQTYHRRRQDYTICFSDPSLWHHLQKIHLRSPRATALWLSQFGSKTQPIHPGKN